MDGTKSSCNFVEYERDNVKDIIHIENLEKLWGKKAVFINTIVRGFNNSNNAYYTNDSHLYALEDERGDTLAIAKVIDSKNINTGNNYTCISYIQASPNRNIYIQNKALQRAWRNFSIKHYQKGEKFRSRFNQSNISK